MGIAETLSNDNPVFRTYVFWSSILVLKMLLMSILTARKRFSNQAMANPEDVAALKNPKVKAPKFGDEEVERVRRAHRNDLENCLPFLMVGFFFVLTNPDAYIAINLIRGAVIARLVHTLVYAIIPTQPARGISWAVCYGVTAYMAVRTALFFF